MKYGRDEFLQFVVRTPQATVVELTARSVRVPTGSGQVGLRPRMEGIVLAVEPGVVLARLAAEVRYVGTAGGILRCDGRSAVLLTPLGVAGPDGDEVSRRVDEDLAKSDIEAEIRATLARWEHVLVQELRQVHAESSRHGLPQA